MSRKIIDGYVRVSHEGDRKDPLTKQVQREKIKGWAAAHDYDVGVILEDINISGNTPWRDRPKVQELYDRVENGTSAGFVVSKLDRISRNVTDGFDLFEKFDAIGATIIALDMPGDGAEPVRGIMLVLAGWQRTVIKKDISDAIQAARKAGKRTAMAPFGYIKPGKGEDLVFDPDTWKLVQECFKRRAHGSSLMEIKRYLADKGYMRATGSVASMFHSETYLGKSLGEKDENGIALWKDTHDAIVDIGVWRRCQDIRAARTRGEKKPRLPDRDAIAKGQIICGNCKTNLTVTRSKTVSTNTYHCRGRHSKTECAKPCNGQVARVDDHIRLVLNAAVSKGLLDKTTSEKDDYEQREKLLAFKEHQLDEHVKITDFETRADEERYTSRGEQLKRERNEAEEKLRQVEKPSVRLKVEPGRWEKRPLSEQREIVGEYTEQIILDRSEKTEVAHGKAAPPIYERLTVVLVGGHVIPIEELAPDQLSMDRLGLAQNLWYKTWEQLLKEGPSNYYEFAKAAKITADQSRTQLNNLVYTRGIATIGGEYIGKTYTAIPREQWPTEKPARKRTRKPSRKLWQKDLDWLRKNGPATVREFAKANKTSVKDARTRLNNLVHIHEMATIRGEHFDKTYTAAS